MKVARRKRRIVARIRKLPSHTRRNVGIFGQLMIDETERRQMEKGRPALTNATEIVNALAEEGHIEGVLPSAVKDRSGADMVVDDELLPSTTTTTGGGVAAASDTTDDVDDSSTALRNAFKRQAAERKLVKHQISLLKKERQKLRPKIKEQRERKKQISKMIKKMLGELQTRHAAERETLGWDGTTEEKTDVDM